MTYSTVISLGITLALICFREEGIANLLKKEHILVCTNKEIINKC